MRRPRGSDVPLFLEFVNIVSIVFYKLTEIITFLNIFLVISFVRYKEYMICPTSFRKFSDVLPAFTCASAIGNLFSIGLGANILRYLWLKTLQPKT